MTESRRITIAIDGYSSCGKSTLARDLARHLGYLHLDTGAMYRAVALALLRDGLQPALLKEDEDAQRAFLEAHTLEVRAGKSGEAEVFLDGQPVGEALRSLEVSALASEVSAWPLVRKKLQALQRRLGDAGGVVMDGRDIGTVVLPGAELKIFMTAELPVRVQRRKKELAEKGVVLNDREVEDNLKKRDYADTHRAADPLRQAPDARLLDTTYLSREQQAAVALEWVRQILKESS